MKVIYKVIIMNTLPDISDFARLIHHFYSKDFEDVSLCTIILIKQYQLLITTSENAKQHNLYNI